MENANFPTLWPYAFNFIQLIGKKKKTQDKLDGVRCLD